MARHHAHMKSNGGADGFADQGGKMTVDNCLAPDKIMLLLRA